MMPRNRDRPTVSCVAGVLAGGHSRRMGRPKALLPLPDGRTLIEHVVAVASDVAREVVILGESVSPPAPLADLPVLPDAEPDGGPLAGLCALLNYAGHRWGLLVACDMPCLGPSVLRRLLSHATGHVDAVAFSRDRQPGTYHACCALYHPRVLPEALVELGEGNARLQNILARVRVASLRPVPEETRQLTNVNTLQAHTRALGST